MNSDKQTFILAFFQYHRKRAEHLLEMWDGGHQDDAFTLCCCYLDGLASFVYLNSQRSAYNFVRLLREHGKRPELSKCLPLALVRWMETQGGWRKASGNILRIAFGPSITSLITETQLRAFLSKRVGPKHLGLISREVWRASVASIAYNRLRIPFVHNLGGPGAVIVAAATGGNPEVSIDFHGLHGALLAAMDHFEGISRTSGKWFGHDFKP